MPKKFSVRDLCYIALMAALLAVCSWITIPAAPVPFTMQTFGVFAALGLLGGRRGTAAIGLWLCMGLIGLPVFSGFAGGPGQLLGVTGGYLMGFLASTLLYWGWTARLGTAPAVMAAGMALGLLLCYGLGTAWFLLVYTGGGNSGTLLGALTLCVFPYVLPDVLKLSLALLLTRRVGRFL